MKSYELEVAAIGTYTIIDLSDRSGCSDVDVDCWQEVAFTVVADSIEEAVRMAYREYDKLNREYTNTCDTLYYNPNPLSEEEADEGDAEIMDARFGEPRTDTVPLAYSKEVELD